MVVRAASRAPRVALHRAVRTPWRETSWWQSPWLVLILLAFALASYGPSLGLAFIGDDYVFLDKTRNATVGSLWSLRNTDFGWYRPWSREIHFWAIQRIAGPNELVFRAASIVLWVAALGLYAAIVRRLASPPVAAIATLGVASLALWGTPLLWISGSQDLWMLCLALASTLLFVSGRVRSATLPFGLALLSKETAAVVPALFLCYLVLVERRSAADALRLTAPFWALTFVWLAVHPTLHSRLLSGVQVTPELEHRPGWIVILAKTLLSCVNLDVLPHPEPGRGVLVRAAVSTVVLVVGVVTATRASAAVGPGSGLANTPTLARFAAAWMVIGWCPVFLPSIGWHAYYGCLGALGAWFGIALWLQPRRRLAIAVIVVLSVLRAAQARTLTWDWGNESYLQRAGNILSAIRDELYRQHPTLEPHSRVYFAHIPNNIGLIAGQSPAIRVWYRDSTLEAGFYSSYRPRPESSRPGEDLFFRFDSAVGMVEVKAGPEDVRLGLATDLNWEGDHEGLAMLFLRSGDVPRAALEFEKLSLLRHRPDAAIYAGVCWEAAGDKARSDSLLAAGRARMELSAPALQAWVARLRATLPGP